MSKPYELLEVLPDGTERRRYENGDIRNQNGAIIETDRLREHAITSETTEDFRRLRKQKMLAAIESGLMRVTEAPNPAEAVAHIVSKRAEVAMNDSGRAGNDAAKIVLAAMDALPDKQTETVHTQRHEYSVDPDVVRIVEEMVRLRRDGVRVVDGIEINTDE